MKIKIKDLNANPHKKLINKGKLNQEHVDKLKANMKELKLMGSVPVVQIDNKYYMVSHHHRIEALKQEFGQDYEVECTLHDYTEEQLMRGMVVENITQRKGEFREEIDNLVAIRAVLKANPEWLSQIGIGGHKVPYDHPKGGGDKRSKEIGCATISKWLNKNGETMSHTKINELLRIHDNLDEELKKEVEKKHNKPNHGQGDESINYGQATMLSLIKDKQEQKDMAKVLKKSQEQRVRNQGELLVKYKDATPEVKKAIRTGKTDIADIDVEIWRNYKKSVKENTVPKGYEPRILIKSELDKLLNEGDKFISNWKFFINHKLELGTKEDRERFEMKKKSYKKEFEVQNGK